MVTLEAPPQELSVSQTFWKSLMEIPNGEKIRQCIQCGTCTGVCPFGRWMQTTPRKIIAALRMNEVDEMLQSDTAWMCVSCYACSKVCPQQLPLTDGLMFRLKEELLLNGHVPAELQTALENSRRYGNPMGESPKKRAAWAEGIEPPIPILRETRKPVDVLWFVGDFASYHPEGQKAARALVKVLRALNVQFGILGPDEVSDGDSQRMAGERGLFEWLAIRNGAHFMRSDFNMILTTDPHAYNAIKNHYPLLEINYPVQHYTQFLYDRLDQLKPLLHKEISAVAAYHDPCYLGRVNGVYVPPRELLKAIPGVELVEMSHHHDASLCCGGGGGGMWLDGFQWEKTKSRLSEWRMREVVATRTIEDYISVIGTLDAGRRKSQKPPLPEEMILAVACPYEKPRFADATKTIEEARHIRVMDIAELLASAM
ncbi:MAG: hypothetical protein Fur0043_16160 [Anaerolineales bacterium]